MYSLEINGVITVHSNINGVRERIDDIICDNEGKDICNLNVVIRNDNNDYIWKNSAGNKLDIREIDNDYLLNLFKYLKKRAIRDYTQNAYRGRLDAYLPQIYFKICTEIKSRGLDENSQPTVIDCEIIKREVDINFSERKIQL